MKTYYTYILECADSTLYTGMTNNLEKRIAQHQTGYNPTAYTFNRRPVKLAYFAEFSEVLASIAFEKKLKGWSAQKKRAFIKGDIKLLKDLAQCRNHTHYLLYRLEEGNEERG